MTQLLTVKKKEIYEMYKSVHTNYSKKKEVQRKGNGVELFYSNPLTIRVRTSWSFIAL